MASRRSTILLLCVLGLAHLAVFVPAGSAMHDLATEPMGSAHGALPSARSDATAVFAGAHVYVFGGVENGTSLGEVLRFDPAQPVSASNPVALDVTFPPRHGMAGVWDAALQRVLLFGGMSAIDNMCDGPCRQAYDDVRAFYPGNGTLLTLVPADESADPTTVGMGAALVDGVVYLFGGCDAWGEMCSDRALAYATSAPDVAPEVLHADGSPLAIDAGRSPLVVASPTGNVYVIGAHRPGEPDFSPVTQFFPGEGTDDPVAISINDITPGATGAAGAFVDDRFYVLGGERDGSPVSDAVRYAPNDPDLDIGDRIDHLDLLFPARAWAAHAWTGEALYLFGGVSGEDQTNEILEVRPAPLAIEAVANGAEVLVTFDRPLTTASIGGFSLHLNGTGFPLDDAGLDESGVLRLMFPPGIGSADDARLSYSGDPWSPPMDEHGNAPLRFGGMPVSVETPQGDLPASREAPALAWDDDRVLVFGGDFDSCQHCDSNSVLAYWPANGSTLTLAFWDAACCSASVETADAVYLSGGGEDGSALLRYDRMTQAIAVAGHLPPGLYGPSLVVDPAGQVYVVAGWQSCSESCTSSIYRLTPSTGAPPSATWLADLPAPARWGTAAAWLVSQACPGGCVYVFGGIELQPYVLTETESFQGHALLADVLRFDPQEGTGVETFAVPDFPNASMIAPFVHSDGSVFLLGGDRGSDGWTAATADTLRFFPEAGEILTLTTPLDTPRAAPAAWDRIGETAYLVGGADCDCSTPASIAPFSPDLLPPAISPVISPAPNTLGWRTAPTSVEWTPEEGSSTSISVDEGAFVPGNATTVSSDSPTGIERTIALRERDINGNMRTSDPLVIRVDEIAPVVSLTGDSGVLSGASAAVVFGFSEPMHVAATEAAVGGATGWTKTWSSGNTILTVSHADVPIGEHTLFIGPGATDAHGVPLAGGGSRTITRLAPASETTPPAETAAPPGAPRNLTVSMADTLATLVWQPPVLAEGQSITGYRVYVDGAFVAELASTEYTSIPLARGATHAFRVVALNAEGEGSPANASATLLPVSSLVAPPATPSGWHLSPPFISFASDPADATILADFGAGEAPVTGHFTLEHGETVVRWRAVSNGISEATQETRFRVDVEPPVIGVASLDAVAPLPGDTLIVTALVRDAGSGVGGIVARLIPLSGGAPQEARMFIDPDGAYRAAILAPEGGYDVVVVARDVAGHETTRSAGAFSAAPPAGDDPLGLPIERTSQPGSGGEDTQPGGDPVESARVEPPPPGPVIRITQPDGVDVSLDAGARGVVIVRIDGADEPETIVVVLVSETGEETILSEGALVTEWDTSLSPDGYYTIEVRRLATPPAEGELTIQSAHTGGVTLASARVLVRNPAQAPATVALAVAAGVAIMLFANVATNAFAGSAGGLLGALSGGGSSASASSAAGFDAAGFAQEVAGDAGEDKLRDHLKEREAKLIENHKRIRSRVAAVVSLGLLAGFWAVSEMEAWTLRGWLAALPYIGLAAVVITVLKYSTEGFLARITQATPRIRLLLSGAIALAFSTIVLRNPFGYPGYVDETEEYDGPDRKRVEGRRALATLAGAAAFVLPFLAAAFVLPWKFADIGLLLAVTHLATSAMPFGPLPGRDVWRWSKLAAVGAAAACLVLYVAYATALTPIWSLWILGVAGAGGYAYAVVHFRRTMPPRKPHEASVPIARSVPVVDADAVTRRERERQH